MPHLTITRLKVKSFRQIPSFLRANEPTFQQVMNASGFMAGKALVDFSGGAWTQTLWESPDDIRAFYLSGEHRILMSRLNEYACEASTRTLEWSSTRLPSWWQACRLLQEQARYSAALKAPTPDHLNQRLGSLWLPLLSRPLKPAKQPT